MLTLPIKKKWFDMIQSGEKWQEYREASEYYIKRFGFEFGTLSNQRTYMWIRLRNGYAKNSPTLECRVMIYYGFGLHEWGAPKKECFILQIMDMRRIV